MSSAAIRLVIKSRRRLVREGIMAYLAGRPEFAVVGQTGCTDELAELCVLRRPDVALVDTVELTMATVEALRRTRLAAPATELVVTYADAVPDAFEAAVRADVTALVPCSRGLDAVLRRVRECAHPNGHQQPDGRALTEHDLTIVSLMSSGHNVPQIADLLRISPRTVENRKRRLYLKLGVGSSAHAVSRATALGLLDLPVANSQVWRGERGRAPLAVVHGSRGPTLDRVLLTLLKVNVPLVHARLVAPLGQEHWARWHRGPIVRVLVDPTYDDWAVAPIVGTRTMVVLSGEPDLSTLVDLMLRGAQAVVPGDDLDSLDLVLSIVERGYLAVGAAYLEGVAGWLTARLADSSPAAPALTTREYDILRSIASGHSVRQTARSLGIAVKTVENTQSRLFRKLGVHNRAAALVVANQLGLLEPASRERASVPVPRPAFP